MMRRIAIAALAALLCGCSSGSEEQKVLARAVPERADDFVWENELICYRAYGEALEGQTLSPGLDVWVKIPGILVSDKWYKADLEEGLSYHKNHGEGKDCYKVGVSLGAGASSVMIDGKFCFPATNWRSCDTLEYSTAKVVFVLHYPAWETCGETISLDKKITVEAGNYWCRAEDTYTFSGPYDSLEVAAGIIRHDVVDEFAGTDRFAIWEHASDQSAEKEEGMMGLFVCMPGCTYTGLADRHSICSRKIVSGEPVKYMFGNCWTGGAFKSSSEWFDYVKKVR